MDPKMMRFYSRLSGAVMLKIALIFGAWKLGELLDAHFHTDPYLKLLLVLVAASLGLWWILWIADHTKLE